MLIFFLILVLSCAPQPLSFSSTTTTITTHNRRALHQPFLPLESQPPSPSPPTPQIPISTPTPNPEPFFPTYPFPPPPPSPPSPSSSAYLPANISSLSLPQTSSKPKTTSTKVIAAAVTSIVAAVVVISIVIFLHIRRRKRQSFTNQKNYRSDNSSRYGSNGNLRAANGIPKLQRPSQNSSEFLYLGTLVSSRNGIEPPNGSNIGTSGGGSNVHSRKLDSPELHPLPPLSKPCVRQNCGSADVGSIGDDEEDFYSPRGSLGGRQSSVRTGSVSRGAFAAIAAENLEEGRKSGRSTSSSFSPSSSASPVRSVSLSISPPVSMSPRSSRPKSPELVAVQTILPRTPPPPPAAITPFINVKDSPLPSPPSSLSPERDLRKSQDSSPRLSNVSDQNLLSSARDSRKVQVSSPRISVVWDRNAQSPVRGLRKSEDSSPGISNASNQNSPTRDFRKRQDSSPRISNVSDQVLHFPERDVRQNQRFPSNQQSEFPERISISIQQNAPVHVPPPFVSVPSPPSLPSRASIPPPPPPPPARHWESPRTPTPRPREQMSKPPVLRTPLRPLVQSPSLVSPVVLAPTSETVEKSEESQHEETPKPKLKPLHWDKVRASSDREMVWDQLRSSSFKLNEEMIETLFVVKTPSSNPKEPTKGPVLPTLKQENRVLDPKKSQNIAILLRALNVTIEEVCEALLEGNADTLGTDLLESLLKMAPTKEEERKLKEYKDDSPVNLGPAERFLKSVLDIPFAFKRVDAMLYISNFDSEIEYLKKSFETLEAACEELRNSRMFLKLLEAVLKTGNRMNVGTNRGDAHAFKLDTLLKLVDVKGADGKTTLLHFVVQEIIRSEGARLSGANQYPGSTTNDDAKCRKLGLEVVSGLCSELTNVKKAAAMDSEVLNGDVLKLSRGIGKIAEVVNKTMGSDESNWKYSESMNRFMKMAEEEVIRVQAQESVALTLVKEITEYFHGNSAKEEAHPFRIFMVVRDFLKILDRVCKDVGMINERTIFSSAHKFPVPVNPTLPPGCNGFPGRRQYSSSDEESSSS